MPTETKWKVVVIPPDEGMNQSICGIKIEGLQGKIFFCRHAVSELEEHNANSTVATVNCRYVRKEKERFILSRATLSPGYILTICIPDNGYWYVQHDELDRVISEMKAYL